MMQEKSFYEKWVKKIHNFLCALLDVIVFSPVLAVTALLVRFKLVKPILFTKEWLGLNKKTFKLYKFQSMIPQVFYMRQHSIILSPLSSFVISEKLPISPIQRAVV